MSTKLTYTGAEVQELLDKIEKGDFDNAKTLEGHPASYFAIASEFTSLAESFATEQGRINTLYSYFNNGSTNDALRLGGQLPSYYATATQYEILQQTLSDFKSLFDSMFEKDSDGNIHAKLSLWSSGGITAGGVGSGSTGGGGVSYDRLDSWADYSADKAGYVLSALLGKDLDNRVSALANAGYITASYLAPYALRSEIPSLVGYATQSWVSDNYLSKSGGTLADALTVKGSGSPLTVHRTQPLASVVKFVNTDGNLGWLGVDIDKTAIFMEASGVINKLLHSGNIANYVTNSYIKSTLGISDWALASVKPTYTASEVGAVSVYGGTINSPSLASLVINRNNSTGASVITFTRNSDFTHFLGFNDNSGPKWLNADYQEYPLLHSGNYADYITNSYIKSTLGISDWALASAKPTYTASEVGALGVNDTANSALRLATSSTFSSHPVVASVVKEIRFDTLVAPDNLPWATGYNNAILSISRFNNELYTTQIGFSAERIYARIFEAKAPDTTTEWQTLAFTSDIPTKLSQLTDDVVAGNYLSKSGGTITGALTSSSIIKASSFFSTSISIECGANGVVDPITYGGEINRFSSNLYLQNRGGNIYLSHASGTTYIRGKLNGVGATFTDTLTVPSITIGGVTLTYDSVNEALCINGNMYALGGITAGGAGISAYSSLEARVARLEQQLNIS